MPDEYVQDNLQSILDSIKIIQERLKNVARADDFMVTPNGVTLLDSIAMRLQVIGELFKNIDKADHSYLKQHKDIEWEKIIRMRDLISHHYDTVNPDVVYDVCVIHLPLLKNTVERMLKIK